MLYRVKWDSMDTVLCVIMFRYKDVNLNILLSATSTDKYFWAKNALPELKRLNRQVNGLSYVLHKHCSKFHIRNLLHQ
jgi:hypothetical protein